MQKTITCFENNECKYLKQFAQMSDGSCLVKKFRIVPSKRLDNVEIKSECFFFLPEMWPERCLKAKCEMIYLRQCPEDSILVTPLPPPGECCAPPAQCQCDIQVYFFTHLFSFETSAVTHLIISHQL